MIALAPNLSFVLALLAGWLPACCALAAAALAMAKSSDMSALVAVRLSTLDSRLDTVALKF